MADGHFPDVELLRRELASLILEWAGKAVKDDPEGPMSTALTRAVSDSARTAVAEQHQILTADAADRIAEALERRRKAEGLFVWRVTPLGLGLVAVVASALLTVAFLLGLQTGRAGSAEPAPATTAATAPIAPLAPAVDEPVRPIAKPNVTTRQPPARAQSIERSGAKPSSRPPPRELGRPAPAADEASPKSTQPVGAAATTPSTSTVTPPR